MADNPTRTEAIKKFLTAATLPELAGLYSKSMECQVNVGQDGGTPIQGEFKGRNWQAWTDGLTNWKSFRIPVNAATTPEFYDPPMSYDLAEHADAIGMTGWDWEHRISKWVGFDFDAIVGHSEKHTKSLTNEELLKVQEAASAIPWVTIRRSTSGKGLHLYVFLAPVHTENHTEHAAVARAVLGLLSALTGFDFDSKVDVCGANMWVWGRKMKGTAGLTLVKAATEILTAPVNWKDHIPVIRGRAKKTVPLTDDRPESERLFDELSGQHPRITLDEEHKKLTSYLLEENPDPKFETFWDQDRHMLVTHTLALDDAFKKLGLRGVFKTASRGSSSKNCFCIPLRGGAWAVRRYSLGVGEAETWGQDALGYTKCTYNQNPDLATACRSKDGLEDEKGAFQFGQLEVATEAAKLLGVHSDIIDIAPWSRGRTAWLKKHKDGRLVISFERKTTDMLPASGGWLPKEEKWIKFYDIRSAPSEDVGDIVGNYDDLIRHLVTETGEDYGWVIKSEGESWSVEPFAHVKVYLASQSLNSKESNILLGRAVARPWTIVNIPFKEEYPGDRKWNRGAAQFKVIPSQNIDSLSYPHWLKILSHTGASLDGPVRENPWCKANAILTGADYLKVWIASMFQFPMEPLPYLFFFGAQDSGKSILHEAISLLMTKGYQRAEAALMSQSGFNGELEAAICCVVEEVDLSDRKQIAYNRIKDWVTGRTILIHYKNRTPYQTTNATHWMQFGNHIKHCPVFPGDSRIVMVEVAPLDPTELIPKRELITRLEAEASDFLAAVLNVEIPPPISRLNVPVINTEEKIAAQMESRNAVEVFLDEKVFDAPGETVLFADLWTRFQEATDPSEVVNWTQRRFGSALPSKFPKGRVSRLNGAVCVGNMSFSKPTAVNGKRITTRVDDRQLTWLVVGGSNDNNT